MAGFEWDRNKELVNFRKHGFGFTTATLIWSGETIEDVDGRRDYGETRIIATGKVEDMTIVVVFTQRGESRRIISARKANSREKAYFEAQIQARRPTPD